MAVVPLRNVRRALKTPPPVMAPQEAEGFRTRIKAVELEAERLQQEAMYSLAQSGRIGSPAPSKIEAARASVTAYQAVLRPFPARSARHRAEPPLQSLNPRLGIGSASVRECP